MYRILMSYSQLYSSRNVNCIWRGISTGIVYQWNKTYLKLWRNSRLIHSSIYHDNLQEKLQSSLNTKCLLLMELQNTPYLNIARWYSWCNLRRHTRRKQFLGAPPHLFPVCCLVTLQCGRNLTRDEITWGMFWKYWIPGSLKFSHKRKSFLR